MAYAPLSGAQRIDAGQCRLTCDRSLYFCEATDDLDQCGGTWTQCRAACSRPALSGRR